MWVVVVVVEEFHTSVGFLFVDVEIVGGVVMEEGIVAVGVVAVVVTASRLVE